MQICLFTDTLALNFKPLTLTRPVDDLRIGIYSIRKKWEISLSADPACRLTSPLLQKVFPGSKVDPTRQCYWINSRFLPTAGLITAINELQEDEYLSCSGQVVAALTSGKKAIGMIKGGSFSTDSFSEKRIAEKHLQGIENLWDLMELNEEEISNDIHRSGLQSVSGEWSAQGVELMNREQIYIHPTADIEPGTMLIAREGPVVIEAGVHIEAGSIIRGPVAICEDAQIKMGAQLYGGTTIGPVCKIGGTVGKSIFHSYSNKAHDGFVGNSLVGQWVNFGADSNTSNLKNNYTTVRVRHWESGRVIETGVQFLGTIIGDHSKTAINTALNTGTVCGVSSNLFEHGFPPKYIPSFTWMGGGEVQEYRFDKAVEAMAAMMARRGKKPDPAYLNMMKDIFENR